MFLSEHFMELTQPVYYVCSVCRNITNTGVSLQVHVTQVHGIYRVCSIQWGSYYNNNTSNAMELSTLILKVNLVQMEKILEYQFRIRFQLQLKNIFHYHCPCHNLKRIELTTGK